MTQLLTVSLHISAAEYLKHYRGVPHVFATSADGRQVRLPASALRPFVTREGIHGTFRFHLGRGNKLQRVEKL